MKLFPIVNHVSITTMYALVYILYIDNNRDALKFDNSIVTMHVTSAH